jgi:DNA-binding response OmpR family regulator
MARILLVDDDPNCGAFLRLFLHEEGHEVRSAISSFEAYQVAADFMPDLLISDWLLKDGLDGHALALGLRRRWPDLPVIFISGVRSGDVHAEIAGISNVRVVEKPIDLARLLPMISECGPAFAGSVRSTRG